MNPMPKLTRRATIGLTAGSLFASGLPTEAQAAPVRGGKLVYGRYADSLFLDGVQTELNVDIWVLSSIYDTLLLTHARMGLG